MKLHASKTPTAHSQFSRNRHLGVPYFRLFSERGVVPCEADRRHNENIYRTTETAATERGRVCNWARSSMEAWYLKQRPFSGFVNKNSGAGYSPIISVHYVNVAISITSITFKSVFFIRCRRSDSSIFVNKWNLTAAAKVRSFSQRPQAAIRQLRAWPRIHVQPRFQRGFRNEYKWCDLFTLGQFWNPGIVVACFRLSFRHQVCPRDNSSPVQARLATFGPKMQNTLVKVPIACWGWVWGCGDGQSTLTFKVKFN